MINMSNGAGDGQIAEFKTRALSIRIGAQGQLCALERVDSGRDYLAADQAAPLLSIRVAGQFYPPLKASWSAQQQCITLFYPAAGVSAVIGVEAKPTHVAFEIAEIAAKEAVELVLWGPYPTTIGTTIGGTVGVVRDPEFALGIQALNSRTLGGYPSTENDERPIVCEPYAPGDYTDILPEMKDAENPRGDTAVRTPFGSILQAYCRERSRDRVMENWGQETFVARAFEDGGVIGSRIALFGCPAADALAAIGEIELAEGLPHPIIDGAWGKVSPGATASYLVVDFGEDSIDQAIQFTRQAGLRYLYHASPFETWGHFRLKSDLFPNGWEGFRQCAEKARAHGIKIGFHTLSNFTTPDDAYVTPVPDPRLARGGAIELADDITATQDEIPLTERGGCRYLYSMNAFAIGEELIKFGAVSDGPPWRLMKCERGAWGTVASAHAKGTSGARLLEHEYKVFLTDPELSIEVARRIAAFCNETGACQLSFDGLEGNVSTGMGRYGRILFTKAWYDALSPELQGKVINDASGLEHFNWHIATRMNWGEPWHAGFRESQIRSRLNNQPYFACNLMPHMLGWFTFQETMTLADIEWMLALAAGFDAGFALAVNSASSAMLASAPGPISSLGEAQIATILETVRQWETARTRGAFPDDLKPALQDISKEFHLEPVDDDSWDLHPVSDGGPPVRLVALHHG